MDARARRRPAARLVAVVMAIAAAALGAGCSVTDTTTGPTVAHRHAPGSRAHARARAASRRATKLPAASGVSLISEPADGIARLLTLIAHARHTVTLTMYELADVRVERALAAAARRGVDVRVVLNGGYWSHPERSHDRDAYAYLAAHGVHVRWSPTYFALTHQKTLVVDGTTAAIMTLNFDGLYASTRDFAVVDRRRADVRAIAAVFAADYAGRRDDDPSPGSGDLVWSPGAQHAVLNAIDRARHSILLESEEMAYRPATDALCAAARRGASVRIVMTYESDWRDAFAQLRGCGAGVRLYHGQRYYIHAKVLITDAQRALVSSQNLSTTSLEDNRELGIELSARPLVRALGAAVTRDWERGARR